MCYIHVLNDAQKLLSHNQFKCDNPLILFSGGDNNVNTADHLYSGGWQKTLLGLIITMNMFNKAMNMINF